MTPEQFCYWLQGMLEVDSPTVLTPNQVKAIKDHLGTVFNKVTPKYPFAPINPIPVWQNPHITPFAIPPMLFPKCETPVDFPGAVPKTYC